MKVVLAEKPSVARDIASVLGANTRKDGYFEGSGYAVTYAFGHLVQIAEPETMNAAWGKPWRLAQLPMIPDRWQYRITDKANAQFRIIKKLLCDPATSGIVCATDAGREGEHIFRLIYEMSGCRKPVQRLWISSLTADAIRNGFKTLKPGTDFDNLANAASGRARADWIVGLNFTRAYTVVNHQLCTVGRVQTPTLALIVNRQTEIDNFQSKPFFEILVTFEPGFLARYITPGNEPQTRLQDKAQAQKIHADIAGQDVGTITKIETKERKIKAPPLYDLLSLQKDANKRFGYTAQETLDIAQNLYEEHKAISYPRTESRHLSNDMVGELPRILTAVLQASTTSTEARKALAKQGLTAGQITENQLKTMLGKAYVDDTKLTDHHAIIPTDKTPTALPPKQRNIYDLIATRFMSIFLPPEVRDETEALITIANHTCRARGVVIKDPGWTVLEYKSKDKDTDKDEEAQQLPALTQGQQVRKRKADLKESKTTPPKPYDDASLLTAMKSAGREINDEDLAAYMKQSGLGTPATRAQIIERLLTSGYILRSKKALLPTEKGKALIESIHPNLKDIALTAKWEQQLSDMIEGKVSLPVFENEIANFLRRLLPEVTKQGASLPATQNRSFPTKQNHSVSAKQHPGAAKQDPGSEKQDPSAPMQESGIGPCPQCKQGVVRKTPKGAGCSRWREGCKFTIWREMYGKKLTDNQIAELATKGKTKLLKGFKKKSGSGTYDARLVLTDEFKVRLDFD